MYERKEETDRRGRQAGSKKRLFPDGLFPHWTTGEIYLISSKTSSGPWQLLREETPYLPGRCLLEYTYGRYSQRPQTCLCRRRSQNPTAFRSEDLFDLCPIKCGFENELLCARWSKTWGTGCGFDSGPGALLCGVYMFSLCLFRCSGFLPQSKNVYVRLSRNSKLSKGERKWLFMALWWSTDMSRESSCLCPTWQLWKAPADMENGWMNGKGNLLQPRHICVDEKCTLLIPSSQLICTMWLSFAHLLVCLLLCIDWLYLNVSWNSGIFLTTGKVVYICVWSFFYLFWQIFCELNI